MTAPVIQTDREAAAKLYELFPMLASSPQAASKTAQRILTGDCDDWSSVQLFASHRLAAVEQEREACARVADEQAKTLAWDQKSRCTAEVIASSIRSRNKEGSGDGGA